MFNHIKRKKKREKKNRKKNLILPVKTFVLKVLTGRGSKQNSLLNSL